MQNIISNFIQVDSTLLYKQRTFFVIFVSRLFATRNLQLSFAFLLLKCYRSLASIYCILILVLFKPTLMIYNLENQYNRISAVSKFSLCHCKIVTKMSNEMKCQFSLNGQNQWENMTETDRIQYKNKIKTKAAVLLIQATQHIDCNNFSKAKQLLVYIADLCMNIKDQDEQIQKWVQICCHSLVLIHRNQQKKLKSKNSKTRKLKNSELQLKYNKFTNQFELQTQQLDIFGYQQVLQYVSKINSLLFMNQNKSNNNSSLNVMFFSYWVPFVLTIGLLVTMFVFLIGKNLISQLQGSFIVLQIPSIIVGTLLIVPMVMIILKTPKQKDNLFFSQKLVNQIKLINEDCEKRNVKIQFLLSSNGQKIFVKLKNQTIKQISSQYQIETPQNEMRQKIEGLKQQVSLVTGKHFFSQSTGRKQTKL